MKTKRFDHLVVIGLGYVGLPLVAAAVEAGLNVVGLDNDAARVGLLNSGKSYVDDISDEQLREMLNGGFVATTDQSCLSEADVVVVCVPTPLAFDGAPDLRAIESAGRMIAAHLASGQLVVLESTTYPGTTEEFLQPILEADGLAVGRDFHLAFSPERIDPGNAQYGFRNTPKVVGGVTEACLAAVSAFYGELVDQVVPAKGTREAELTKLLENTYRHINIALMNEMAIFSADLGVDIWDAINCASSKPFGYQAFYPGPGVGGHCIPIDPNYLSYRVRQLGYPFRFVELAQEINQRMPSYVVQRLMLLLNEEGRSLKGASILLLGVTYKADIADERETPATPIGRKLMELGARVSYFDTYVRQWTIDGNPVENELDLEAALGEADAAVLLQAHSSINLDLVSHSDRPVLDTRGVLDGKRVTRL